ncbi:MAG: Ldh family oxidoreductase [Bryobacteraceae bacterium]|nr:Ldh family oxidoreductase [Bryobacteraceae bacterium]
MIRLPHEQLTDLARRVLVAGGVAPRHADLVARVLVAANLRGIDSHGIQLLSFYMDQILAGDLDPTREGHVVSESGGTLVFDGENGLGAVCAEQCASHAARLAREHGIAIVTARESNHFGGCFWWARQIADQGLLAIVMCDASPIVPPWQGREGRFGTNPICLAVPDPEQYLLDMATTTVAAGKIFKANINQQPSIPAGWALDREGVETTSTRTAMEAGPLLMPLGGYKGTGLAMLVEILTGVLSGGGISTDLSSFRVRGRPVRINQTFIALDIARFLPVDEFHARLARLEDLVRSTPAARGFDEVLVAGEPERRIEAQRRAEGCPIEDGNWATLQRTAAQVGVKIEA